MGKKGSERKNTMHIGLVLFAFILVFNTALSLAEEKQPLPNPDDALGQAELEMLEEFQPPEELPVTESANNGYWWIKQDYDTKVSYIKYLVEAFGLEPGRFKVKDITERLDILYNPKDNPLDIKMDISVERAFDTIIRGMKS